MAATIRTETYNTLLTTTMRNMRGAMRDEISKSNKWISYLDMRGQKRFVGSGRSIDSALKYEHNRTGDIYQGYGILDTTPPDGHTVNGFPWAQLGLTITINGYERRVNQGREAIFNLLQVKKDQATATAKEMLSSAVLIGKLSSGATGNLNQFVRATGRIDPSAQGPYPLPALVDASPARSVTIGEVNGATETWWQNKALAATATTLAGLRQNMLRIYQQCSRGVGGEPDIVLSDELSWQVYYNGLETKERYIVADQRTIDVLGGSRDSMIMYRNAVTIWDEYVPDVGTTTATPENYFTDEEIGTYLQSGTHGTMFFLNSNTFEYVVHPQADWTMTPFLSPVNQPDSSTAAMLWMGQMVINSRRKNGVLYDIDNSLNT